MKKIINIITRISFGGSSENVIDICDRLNKDGFDVVLIYGGEDIKKFGFKSYCLNEMKREVSVLNDIKSLFKIIKIILNEKPDIIHTHTSKAGIIGRLSGFIYKIFLNKKVKIIHTPHGHIFYGYFSKPTVYFFVFLEFIVSFLTDYLIALTENEKKETLSRWIGNERKWLVIPSGINYDIKLSNKDLKKELNISKEELIIGTVSRLEPVKGIEYLIRSIKYLNNIMKIKNHLKFPVFLIVGDGTQMDYLKHIVKEDNIKEQVIFSGYRNDVLELINIMDIYIQPSVNEGMGRTVVMAQLLKKPIVASSVCGLKDLVKDGVNGFWVESKNPLDIAIKLFNIISDKKMYELMRIKSFEIANYAADGFKYYSFERQYFLYRKLYIS